MAFCTNCGAKVEDGTRFCPNCGAVIAADVPAQTNHSAPKQQEAPSQYGYGTAPQNAAPQQPEAPSQYNYGTAPQGQQPYAPAAAQTSTAQKKPFNKKLLFIIGGAALLVIIIVVLIIALAGKAGSNDPNLGVYNATKAEMSGLEMAVTDIWTGGFSIELKANGKCAMEVDGAKGSGKWTLKDGVFHIEGDGISCDGTLSRGVMTLENVLDAGVTLTFEKEGGYSDASGTAAAQTGAAATDLQKQWNGTWYGSLIVNSAEGDNSGIEAGNYDVYLVVELDGEGKGNFAVYLSGAEGALALAQCEADENGLSAVSGTLAGDQEMDAGWWKFLPSPDGNGLYTMGDSVGPDGSKIDFTIMVKPWGASWQDEIDGSPTLVPPSVQDYEQKIANGELPPIGFAPVGYKAAGGTDGGSSSGTLSAGEPSSTGDGVISDLDSFYRLAKWLSDMDYSYQQQYCNYEFVRDYCGVEGLDKGNSGPNDSAPYGDHYFIWYSPDSSMYINCGFRGAQDGTWMLANMNTSGFTFNDIPSDITVEYSTATEMGAAASEFAGKMTAKLSCFSSDVVTDLTLTVPDAGWCYDNDSTTVRVYNVPTKDDIYSNSPMIKIQLMPTMELIDANSSYFTDVSDAGSRTIGGTEMKCRTYTYVGMSWTEYYGKLPSGIWMSISITKLDTGSGSECDAILSSIEIK